MIIGKIIRRQDHHDEEPEELTDEERTFFEEIIEKYYESHKLRIEKFWDETEDRLFFNGKILDIHKN